LATRRTRVIVWSTGWIGTIAIRAIHRRPDFELLGVWVHSADKVGKDAGELAGIGPIGLATTDDVEALLGLDPECIVYAASGPEQDAAAVPDYVRFLEAGINVVTVTSPSLIYPPAFEPTWTAQLTAAAELGGVSLYASGIEPGFAADQLPLVLATQSNTITSIRASELFEYDKYPVEFMMRDVMGFGMPLDYEPMLGLPGAQTGAWGPPLRLMAKGLGIELDEIREEFDRVATERTLEVACGTIEAGTCGAIRTQTIGVVDGRDTLVVEHVNRMARDLAPEWPIGERDGTYRIIIEGDPDIVCNMTVGDPEAATAGAMVSTAMRIVNAVPFVVDAPPGLLSSLDLPLTLPQHAVVAPSD
jgi:2,4-diaminopentanoate dehydrogenase